jgi:hypothetical protein
MRNFSARDRRVTSRPIGVCEANKMQVFGVLEFCVHCAATNKREDKR